MFCKIECVVIVVELDLFFLPFVECAIIQFSRFDVRLDQTYCN